MSTSTISTIPTAPVIELAPPTAQYTTRSAHTNVQLHWRPKGTSLWHSASYTPTQADWAARAPAEIAALAEQHPALLGFWSDAEIEADALAYLAATFGFTNVVIVDPDPAQPDEPVAKTTLEKAAENAATSPA